MQELPARRRSCAAVTVILFLLALGAGNAIAALASQTIQLPGAPAFDTALQNRLHDACAAQQAAGPVHAAQRNADGSPQYINRLVFAASPYLQQHAFNPVNWYPWGEEAFATAAREHKPVFLSIGYSTCHWCHVMERECFENEAIARQLNEHFIAIKVDREERPDIDNLYVAAVEHLTGSAGWPLNVFLTADGKPFYGGTYFPPEDRFGKPGFPKLLTALADAWQSKHEQVVESAAALLHVLAETNTAGGTAKLTAETLRSAYRQLAQGFDATNGGFGGAPKFPQAHMLQFLLRYWQRSGESQARRMVEVTLDHMARGGIHDQLGGGFHRYATDAQWGVPHFEKMLYDQAINVRAYLEAYRATGNPRYAGVARDTLGYVLRDLVAPSSRSDLERNSDRRERAVEMTLTAGPGGGFYSAEDADSEGEEGRFYVWSRDEITTVLGPVRGSLVADFYGVDSNGLLAGARSPLRIAHPADEFAKQHGGDMAGFQRTLTEAQRLLLAARARRPRPARDDKIVTAWNGLMISSLAYGSAVLGDPQYASAAARAADFILTHAQRDGRLLRSFRSGPSATPGYLDDYAFFVLGLSDLYAATFDTRWLREADRLSRDMLRLFGGSKNGGLRYSAADNERLVTVSEDVSDGALPAAQSVAAVALLRLGRLTMNAAFEKQGRDLITAYSDDIARAPTAHTEMLMALDFALGPVKEIVIAGAPDAPGTQALLDQVHREYLPRSVIVLHPPGDAAIEALVPFVKRQTTLNDRPTAYVCENYVCKLPTNDPAQLHRLLVAGEAPAVANERAK